MKKLLSKNSKSPFYKNYKDSHKKTKIVSKFPSNRALGHASNYLEPYSGTVPSEYGNLFLKLDKYTVPFVVKSSKVPGSIEQIFLAVIKIIE